VLKQRVVTAIVLAALFLALLFLTPWYVFAAGIGVALSFAAWEWSALSGWRSTGARGAYVLLTVLLGLGAAWALVQNADSATVRSALVFAAGWWALALLWVQSYPSSAILWRNPLIRGLMGWLVLIPAWYGLLFLRRESDGPLLILLVVLLIACADIGAYFSGRAFGRHKLAPSVSPGKSWEGVLGGLLAASTVALVLNALWGSGDWLVIIAIVVPTVFVSVLGDLFESMVKRHAGVKDSGHILPGHGGVLDRIDGLTAAVPVFALALVLTGWQL
jgi:phosphatidate cytidylyltransferase